MQGTASTSSAAEKQWLDAVKYVALRIALKTGKIEKVGGQPKIVRHNLDRTVGCSCHERFWDALFRRRDTPRKVAAVTTNYDVLIERGLRPGPRPRRYRPGFNYGFDSEVLAGGGYPSYTHIRPFQIVGSVPVIKLHGSISWSIRQDQLVKYHDCRPAIRGDAAIVAPIPNKSVPAWLKPYWELARQVLMKSKHWFVVGYSLPKYDKDVNSLLSETASRGLRVDVFNPDYEVVKEQLKTLIPHAAIYGHPGLPEAIERIRLLPFVDREE